MLASMIGPSNRLQRKVLAVILAIVVIPMLAAGGIAASWVSSHFEHRLEQWIIEASRVDRIWLKAYQNDALMLGRTLSHDRGYRAALSRGAVRPPAAWRHIARSLGLRVIQVYNGDRQLIYSSTPLRLMGRWLPGQRQAVLRAIDHHHDMLVAIGVTPIALSDHRHDYVLLGGLLNRHFIAELSQLTGLDTTLYYRAGQRYLDVLSRPGHITALRLSRHQRQRLLGRHADYDTRADTGRFRGLYTPIADSSGRVEAIVFNGLKRGGLDTFITHRGALFLAISLVGVVIGGLTGWILSRLIIRPVEHLRNGVMELAGQNFDASVPADSDDELGDLGKAFNAMAERLRMARDDQHQRFRQDKLVALGELSAALAHEIRNPIGIISAAATLLDKPGQGMEKQQELKRMIREESTRVAALVGDFLKLSRNRPPDPRAVDPALPLERALAGIRARYPDIPITVDRDHGGAAILADADLLQQAWTNLLTNAAEAMGGHGEVLISTHHEGGYVTLALEDSGPGIGAAIMPRLFEPFFTTKPSGTGLGLSIAAALVEANNGQLTAEMPQRLRGARFVMRFPILSGVTQP